MLGDLRVGGGGGGSKAGLSQYHPGGHSGSADASCSEDLPCVVCPVADRPTPSARRLARSVVTLRGVVLRCITCVAAETVAVAVSLRITCERESTSTGVLGHG